MAKSDIEDCCESPILNVSAKMAREQDNSVLDKSNDSTIHSGHFMVSDVHHDTDEESDLTEIKEEQEDQGYDFISAVQEPTAEYQFGDRCVHSAAIDSSLTKLFECMTLAYSGKLTSPKWKNFKGIKLLLKEKVRLNNIIWREWHMQYIQGQRPIICQFEPPISDKTHTKPEGALRSCIARGQGNQAVVLEGKYWKRRLESVTAEYKKWRMFFKQRFSHHPDDERMMEEVWPKFLASCVPIEKYKPIPFSIDEAREEGGKWLLLASHAELLERVGQQDNARWWPTQPAATTEQAMDDDFSMDFTDTLFTSLNQPFAFPNPREMSQLGISCADIIQPGLVQLQPSLDEFMDTLEPLPSLQEMLNSRTLNNSFGSVNTTSGVQNLLNNMLATNLTPLDLMPGNQSTNLDLSGVASPTLYSTVTAPTPPSVAAPSLSPIHIAQPSPQSSSISNMTVRDRHSSGPDSVQAATNANSGTQMITFYLDPSDLQSDSKQASSPLNLVSKPVIVPSVPSVITETASQMSTAGTVFVEDSSSLQSLLESLRQTASQPMQQEGNVAALKPAQTVHNIQITEPRAMHELNRRETDPVVIQSSPVLQSHLSGTSQKKTDVTDITRRASTGSVGLGKTAKSMPARKEGEFLVPQALSPIPRKPRTIAPAPMPASTNSAGHRSSPITQQNTFLAQLLTSGISGTYPNSVNVVKQESSKPSISVPNYHAVQPATESTTAVTSNDSTITCNLPNKSGVNDFQKNILLAAASHALGTTTCKISEAFSPSVPSPGPVSSAPGSTMSDPQSPGSPQFQVSSPGSDSGSPGKVVRVAKNAKDPDYRRFSHISAEQKRRCNIKSGFDTLHQLVPALAANPNKISKAATLQKTADFCRKLKKERSQMQDEAEILRQEIDALNNAISVCQSQLPATGVPVTRQRVDQMRDMFDEYVKSRTLSNWKFWIFSIIIRCLFDTYNKMVSTASVDELCRTVLSWLEQHCSLVALRPAVLNSLRTLSTTTSILSDPSRVPEQAAQAVSRRTSLPQDPNS